MVEVKSRHYLDAFGSELGRIFRLEVRPGSLQSDQPPAALFLNTLSLRHFTL